MEKEKTERRSFFNKLLSTAVLGGLASFILGHKIEKVSGASLGDVAFSDGATGVTYDHSNFFWDDSNNRLGIGTSSPESRVHIKGADIGFTRGYSDRIIVEDDHSAIQLVSNSTDGQSFVGFSDSVRNRGIIAYLHSDDLMAFDTSRTRRITIDSSGNVGIGQHNPESKLHIKGSDMGFTPQSFWDRMIIEDDQAAIQLVSNSTDGQSAIGFSDNVRNRGLIAYLHSDDLMAFDTAGTRKVTIDSSGNVGVGTPNPKRAMHLRGSNACLRMDRDGDSAAFILVRTASGDFNTVWKTFYVGVNAYGVNNGEFFIGDVGTAVGGSSTHRIHITNNGYVGIGPDMRTPEEMLHVAGRCKATGFDTGDIRMANDFIVTEDEKSGIAFKNDAGEKIAVLDREGNFRVKGKITEDPTL